MSRRPKVVASHERAVDREVQRQRQARNRQIATRGKKVQRSGLQPEPQIRSVSRGAPEGGIPKAVTKWIEEEDASQMRHYRRIFRQMEKLEPLREEWTDQFLQRISGPRGFSVHAGQRRTIPKQDLPKRPKRPWRVVW